MKRSFQSLISVGGLLLVTAMLAAPGDLFGRAKDCKLRIAGRVTRSSNSGPVPDRRVEVHLLDAEGNHLRTVRTDNDGYYAFDEVCAGIRTVRPGPVWLANVEGPRLPPLYTPSSRSVTLPIRVKSIISPRHIDFVRSEPPPQRQPEDEREEAVIRIDEATRAGQDLELAGKVREFLAANLPCKGPRPCQLTVKVVSGRVELSGIMGREDRPRLEKIKGIRGVKALSLDRVRFDAALK